MAQVNHFTRGAIWLKVNDKTRQNAHLRRMIWSEAKQISKLSEAFELFPGDVIYSGTPENVGPAVVCGAVRCSPAPSIRSNLP